MEFISNTLGVKVYAEQWDVKASLQYFLSDKYDFEKVTLDGVVCIFMKPIGELGTLSAIKKHLNDVLRLMVL